MEGFWKGAAVAWGAALLISVASWQVVLILAGLGVALVYLGRDTAPDVEAAEPTAPAAQIHDKGHDASRVQLAEDHGDGRVLQASRTTASAGVP